MSSDYEGSPGPDSEIGNYETMRGFAGDDTIGSSAQIVRIYGGDGNDSCGHTYTGTDGTAYIYGEAGEDRIFAGSGNDKCYGGAGNDFLVFAFGEDIYWGGGGRDTFVFLALPDDGLDRIQDFKVKKDHLFFDEMAYTVGIAGQTLSKSQFRGSKKAKDDNDNFGYNKKTGIVWYDPDGVGGQDQAIVVKLDKGLAFSHHNIQF